MSKVVKKMMIDDIRGAVGDAREVLVVDASKVNAVATNQWRTALRAKKIHVLGVKNAVARAALVELGLGGLSGVLSGPSTLIFGGEDIVALAKEVMESTKKIKELKVRGGALGETALNADDVESLSKSPGRMELLSQISGLILSPGARLNGAILGAGACLGGQIKAVADKATGGEAA